MSKSLCFAYPLKAELCISCSHRCITTIQHGDQLRSDGQGPVRDAQGLPQPPPRRRAPLPHASSAVPDQEHADDEGVVPGDSRTTRVRGGGAKGVAESRVFLLHDRSATGGKGSYQQSGVIFPASQQSRWGGGGERKSQKKSRRKRLCRVPRNLMCRWALHHATEVACNREVGTTSGEDASFLLAIFLSGFVDHACFKVGTWTNHDEYIVPGVDPLSHEGVGTLRA